MFIERWGNGEAHFLGIHGWSGDHRTFLPLAHELPVEATFWSVDLPGCGRSEAPSRWHADAIVDELETRVRTPVTLVGNCSGAIFSLLLAQRIPALIRRVVLIDAFAWWPWYFRVFTARSIGRYAYLSTFANPLGRWIANLSLKNKRQTGTDLTRGFAETDHEVTHRYLALLNEVGNAARFAGLRMPVDILYGERSFRAVRESAEAWRRLWPQARICCLRGAGHLPILEATEELRAIVYREILCPIAF